MNLSRSVALLPPLLIVGLLAAACSTASSPSPAPASPAPPSQPPASALTQPSPDASPSVAPALTETFTSPTHGLSVSYPAGWVTRPATERWTTGGPNFDEATGDMVYDPALTDHLFIALASQPIGTKTGDQWIAERRALAECAATNPVTVDGAAGAGCRDGNVAFVTTGGRGYQILLYTSGDEGWLDSVYDRAWFEKILATVKLNPEAAVDAAPSASP
jgi:hypothetical protein